MAAWQAWTVAALVIPAFHKPKKFPKLKDVLPTRDRKPRRPQTVEEQISVALAWTARLAGKR